MTSDFILTIQQGGMIAFEETGVLPEFLIFYSKCLKRSWRVKLKGQKQEGFLKRNGVVAFNYFYDDLGCRMESVVAGVVTEEWEIAEFVMELMD